MRVVLLFSMLSFLSFRMPTQPSAYLLSSSIGWFSDEMNSSDNSPNLSCFDKGQLDVNGSTITITNFKIKNTGFSAASVSYVGYYLSTDKNFTTDDIFLGHDYVDGLSQNESSTENFMIDLSGLNIPNGEYYVGTVIDYMNSVAESNEGDNNDCYWDNPKVVIGGKPNLTCMGRGELTKEDLYIKIGWVKVENTGTAPAGASKVGFYLSTDQNFTTGDVFLGSVDVPSLNPGQFVMIPKFEVDLATLDLSGGRYYVGYIIDYQNKVIESNESDNNDCYYDEIVIIDEIPDGDPNLACKERGTLVLDGDRATINGTKVQNYGDANSTAGQVGYYLSDDTNFTTDDLLVKTRALNALAPGEMQMFGEIVIDLSVYDLDAGIYYLGIIIDDTDETEESNEGDNNTCSWDDKYKVENGEPNLACKARGELIINNDNLDVYIGWTTVGNYGDAKAGPSQVGFYASLDDDYSDDDVLIATSDIGALEPEESQMIDEINTNVASLGLNPGLYKVLAVIDHNNEVAESNEEDNDDCFWDEPKIFIPNGNVDLACKALGELIIDNNDLSYYIGWTTIINNGSSVAGASEIGFYISSDTTYSDDDQLFASQAVGPLASGESYMIEEIEGILDIDLPAGTYNVIAVIDHKEQVYETNEANNDDCYWREPRFFIPQKQADLACKALGELIIDNNDLSYYIGWTTVINNGTGNAGSSKIGFYVSRDRNLSSDDRRFAFQVIGALAPGESQMINEIEGVLDLDLEPGTYYVLTDIDYADQVDESNEANNDDCYWEEPRFYIPEENREPNLTCKERGYLSVNGTKISISNSKITNNGDADANGSKLGIYLSENQSFTTSDILIGTVSVPNLDPGEVYTLNFDKDIAGLGISPGDYFVGLIVDKDNTVEESNESDNNTCYWTNPKVNMIPAKPNLTCKDRGELVITNRTQLKFSWLRIQNTGDATAGASKIGYYLSTDQNITTGDIFLGSVSIGSIGAGQTIAPSSFNRNISNLNLADGTYYAGFIIDYNNQVAESNESDNNDCRYGNKVIIDNAKANLTCKDRGEATVNGTRVKISWMKVMNSGDKKAPASKIGYYLSTDQNFTTDDHFIGSRNISDLNPGEVQTISALDVDVAGLGIAPGTYYIGSVIDYTYAVTESHESDNNDCYFINPKVNIPYPKPNLTCHDRGEVNIDGNNIHVSWNKIKNTGNGSSDATKVGYYLSTDTHFSTGDILLGTVSLPKLSPGEVKLLSSFNKNISDLHLSPGKYYVGIIVDPYNTVAETNESDNNDCYWTSPYLYINPPKPNLTCHSRGEVSANGSTITISWVKAKNNGGSTAGASYVGYYLSTDTHFTTSDTRIGSRYLGSLAAGQTKVVDPITINLSSLSLAPGEYYIGIILDYKDEVHESNETDNNDCYFTTPKVLVHPPKPNLTCKDKGEIVVDGSKIDLSWAKIMNSGGSTAGAHHVGYYLSTDKHFTTGDYLVGSDYVSSLAAGSVKTLPAFHVDAKDKNVPPGYYYFGIIIDYKYHVTESDEYDNNDCFYDYPKVHIPAAKPDLKCKDLGEIELNGYSLHISWSKIMNAGSGPSGNSRVGYYLSKNTTISPSDDIFLGSRSIPGLGAGQHTTVSAFNVDLSDFSIPAGTYYIGYYVDDKYQVTETDEYNNTCYWNSPKVQIQAAKPNLTLKSGSGHLNVNGYTLHISDIKVLNNGGSDAGTSKLGYYLSTDSHISTSDIFIGEDHVAALSPGQISTESENIDLSGLHVPAGTYYVGFIIDHKYQVHESNENDNVYRFNTRVNVTDHSTKPDLACLSSGNLHVVEQGERVRIEGLRVKNIGNKRAEASTIGFYLSVDKNFDENDYFVGTREVGALNPGKTATLTFEEDIPDAYPPAGRYYLGFILDYDKRISESNESNNNDCYFDNPRVVVPDRDGNNGNGGQDYCACSNSNSRTFCESFDAYNAGMLAPQSSCWTTWSGVVGGYEDGVIENSNGNNYLKIKAGSNNNKQDVVLKLGNRTTGKQRLDFKMWLFDGHRGYFNTLHTFAEGADLPEHAFEVYFMGNGTGYLKAEGQQHNFTYPTFEWFTVRQEFDLSNDKVALIINGKKVKEWMFSSKPNSNRSYSRRLAAMNFYPADAQNQFYVDDIHWDRMDDANDDEIESRHDVELPAPRLEADERTTLPSLNMSYYPNPASNELNVEFNAPAAVDMRLELINAMGQVVLRYEEDGVKFVRHQFDVSNQAAGLYYIKVWAGDQQLVRPVVIID